MDTNDIVYKLYDYVMPEYYESLHILLANRDWMPRFPNERGEDRMVIIQLINITDDAKEAVQLYRKGWEEMMRPIQSIEEESVEETSLKLGKKIISVISQNPLQ